jgi:hypothetical protein
MSKPIRILKYFLIMVLIALSSGCATVRQNPFEHKRKKASKVNTLTVGRNRYFFSTDYQKKLQKNYKKKY